MPQTLTASVPEDLEPLTAGLDAHGARLDALEQQEPLPPGEAAPPAPWVGVYAGTATTPVTQASWNAMQRELGPAHVNRSFDSTIKPPATARYSFVNGPIDVYSLKPPNGDVQGFIDGDYSAQYRAVVAGLPAGSYLIVYHEPEDNMSGSTFRDLTMRAYDEAHDVHDAITVVYCANAYKWNPHNDDPVTDAAGWLEAAQYVDAVSLDVYSRSWLVAPMATDGGLRRWWDMVADPSGKPKLITERGISVKDSTEAARMDMLAADWLFACRAGFEMFIYWNSDADGEFFKLVGAAEKALMRTIAAQGRVR